MRSHKPMSRIDGYEYEKRRAPNKRKQGRPKQDRLSSKEVQLALRLMGGTTAKDKGEPFNDEIPF